MYKGVLIKLMKYLVDETKFYLGFIFLIISVKIEIFTKIWSLFIDHIFCYLLHVANYLTLVFSFKIL